MAGTRRRERAGGGGRWSLAVALGCCALAAVAALRTADRHPAARNPLMATASSATPQTPSRPGPTPAAPGIPVSVSVPSVGIHSQLQGLGLLPDHTLQPPASYQSAGWYAGGIRPGAVGPAIIAGHVDSYLGPAVFYRLREIKLGADIEVRDSTGAIRRFGVTDIERYPKSSFPSDAVYGPTSLPVLRLITCTGDFDPARRSYLDNLVVSATLDAARAA